MSAEVCLRWDHVRDAMYRSLRLIAEKNSEDALQAAEEAVLVLEALVRESSHHETQNSS